jgi:hypothetical protein
VALYNRLAFLERFRAFLVLVYPYARQFTLCDSLPFCTGQKYLVRHFSNLIYKFTY